MWLTQVGIKIFYSIEFNQKFWNIIVSLYLGIHALGWSREKAIKYMIDNTALNKQRVESEVNR